MYNDKIYEAVLKASESIIGERASALKLAQKLSLSLSYVYEILKNENISFIKKGNRKLYEVKEFISLFQFEEYYKVYDDISSVEDYLNMAINFEAKNPIESFYMEYLIDVCGEFSSVKEIACELGISESLVYEEIAKGNILALSLGTRKVILTRCILQYIRRSMYDE